MVPWGSFCHFLAFDPPNNPTNQNFEKIKKNPYRYHHFTQVYHKWQSNDIWFLRYQLQMTIFFLIFSNFFAYLPPTAQKTKISKKKIKKTPGDIIILQKYTKKHDHMLYCSWDMAFYRCNWHFSFWPIFCPFTPLIPQKMNISQK